MNLNIDSKFESYALSFLVYAKATEGNLENTNSYIKVPTIINRILFTTSIIELLVYYK